MRLISWLKGVQYLLGLCWHLSKSYSLFQRIGLFFSFYKLTSEFLEITLVTICDNPDETGNSIFWMINSKKHITRNEFYLVMDWMVKRGLIAAPVKHSSI